MSRTRWNELQPEGESLQNLVREGQHAPLMARLLALRGVRTAEEAARFLQPDLAHAHSPWKMPDMHRAVERLDAALKQNEPVLVYGDYDVDGVCAAALLSRVLRALDGNVQIKVPHRKRDGYDLQVEGVRKAHQEGIRLIVTADCGILAFEAAEEARRLGVDLIITDHHTAHASGRIPDALAVVNPRRLDSGYPFAEICGAAVAFKLCQALVEHRKIESRSFATRFLDLVALATCADSMPLRDENRVYVSQGLQALAQTRKKGLAELLRLARNGSDRLSVRTLTHGVGPRINAAGRMDDPVHALNLLMTGCEEEARQMARKLDEINSERREEQNRMIAEAVRLAQGRSSDPILVLWSDRWNPGLIGIAAGRLAETFCRPTILIAVEEGGGARGSCRSVPNFDIHAALCECRRHLQRFGGHPAAAGFDIAPDQLEPFRASMQKLGAEKLNPELMTPCIEVDATVELDELSVPLAQELLRLAPFGHGNLAPVLLSRRLEVISSRRIAARAADQPDHLKLFLRHPSRAEGVEALYWSGWDRAGECEPGSRIDACYEVQLDHYGGAPRLQLRLLDFQPAD